MQGLRPARSRPIMSRLAAAVFAVLILIAGAYFSLKSGKDPGVYQNDFNVYYHASRELINGNDPYQDSLTEWTPYIYPPFLAEVASVRRRHLQPAG